MTVTFNVVSKIDNTLIKSQVEKKINGTQGKLDSVVMQDSNYFCPLKTSVLQKSVIINSTLGSGLLTWKTPYARAQYYGNYDHSKQHNPSACQKWFEAAKARFLEKWLRIANEQYRRS